MQCNLVPAHRPVDHVMRCANHEPVAGGDRAKAVNTFVVETMKRTFFVRAESNAEREAWVAAINGALLNA